MKTMKVMQFNDSAAEPALVATTAPVPQPGSGQVLIRVFAAGVTPSEILWYPTTHQKDGSVRTGAIPGHEFSGVVEAVGEGINESFIGEDVFGMNDWFADGATAEYCLTVPANVVIKPDRLSHAEAASVPIGALTAWQGLVDRAKLGAGERILVHGGSGAVGIYAIQLAKRIGAQVFTTASERNAEFLLQIGADHVIDYRTGHFEDSVQDVDVVFDCVGGATLQRSWAVLRLGGRLVTIAADGEKDTADERTKAAFFIVEPNQSQLVEIAALLDAGKLKAFVNGTVPFPEASAAYFAKAGQKNGWGKVVIDIAAS